MTADNVTVPREAVSREDVYAVVRLWASPAWCSCDKLTDAIVALYAPSAPSVPSPVDQGSFAGAHTQPGAADGVVSDLLAALERFLWWGQQQCPCHEDEPNPCPLCGASVENLEGCKAIEAKFPAAILGQAREAISRAKATALQADADPAEVKAETGR